MHNLWIDGNAPMFTGFCDRVEILSLGQLPSKQTVEGFSAGKSVPIIQKLSAIFLQLYISERSGRSLSKITEHYGEDCIKLRENSIVVTIPFERLETKVYTSDGDKNVPAGKEIPSVENENPTVKELDMGKRILRFCVEAKNLQEIMECLGYCYKKTACKYLTPLLQQGLDFYEDSG